MAGTGTEAEMEMDVRLLDDPLDPEACRHWAGTEAAGAQTLFVGTVRNASDARAVRHLEFEAYAPMALKELRAIAEEAGRRWPLCRVAVHHRVGRVEVGGIAVVIAVSTPHRAEGFEVCRYVIDTLKETVPIWKKEVFEDGETWVSAHP